MSTSKGRGEPPRVVILGALSAIAEAAARRWAEQGATLLLAGRDAERLASVAADLETRGAKVCTAVVDFVADDPEARFVEFVRNLDGVDVVLLAYGVLGDQGDAEKNIAVARRSIDVNFSSAALWCLVAADYFEARGAGTLVVLGSVAGDRGRQSNYVYGAAKAGLGVFVQGIAHRLARSGARAVLVKPGFVDTPMTAHIAGKGPLWASPQTIGDAIVRVVGGGSGPVIYAPWFWRWIMVMIRATPAAIFHRTKL